MRQKQSHALWETNSAILQQSIHETPEVLNVDLSITIRISLSNHRVQLLVREALSQTVHHLTQLALRDIAILIHIKDSKCLFHFVHILYTSAPGREHTGSLDLNADQVHELIIRNLTILVLIHAQHHLFNIVIARILAERPHNRLQLLSGDLSILVLVKNLKGLSVFLLL